MIRLLNGAVLTAACAVLLSCQSYSTGLQQSVARADETSAVAAMKTIATAQQAYLLSNSTYATFPQLCDAGLLDERFNSETPQIKDYTFTLQAESNSFTINADPTRTGETAGRHLFMDSSGPLVHVNATQPATANDPLMKL